MSTRIALIRNGDDAVLFWRIEKPIAGCLGFALEREQKLADGSTRRSVLGNRMGFEHDAPRLGEQRPSTVWPFQRFSWADFSVNRGDRVRYRVVPMVRAQAAGAPGGELQQQLEERSAWTPWTTLSSDAADGFSVYFNRGLVISQFMARYLDDLRREQHLASRDEALKLFKQSLDEHELPIRVFLAGDLRVRMLELLETARKKKQHVFGALYELEDDELLDALEKLGARGHVVLANGSITPKTGESTADARKRDQNKAARKRLRDAGLEVKDRFISPGALGHNKFLVVTDSKRKPLAAWTGSTNWTKTGLCTQLNNGLWIDNAAIAREYLDQWQRLADAQSEFPTALVASNSAVKQVQAKKSAASIWFSRTSKKVDLDALDEIVNGAQDGILFLMFQPGSSGPLATIRQRMRDTPSLYVKGVVSTLPGPDETAVDVNSIGDGVSHPAHLDVVQPQGFATPFANWAATVTREEFLNGPGRIGFAIVHSKVIVVDPFTKPVVVTGSHNFSASASSKNDENFVVVRGNSLLARAYAAHIVSTYQHYRWLSLVQELQRKHKTLGGFLLETDAWQKRHLQGASRRELEFWTR